MSSDYEKKNDDTEIDMSGIIIEDNDVKVTGRADVDTNLSHTVKLQEDSSEDVFEQAAKDAEKAAEKGKADKEKEDKAIFKQEQQEAKEAAKAAKEAE